MSFKDIFPGLSRTLSFNFQDSPGPVIFQDFPGPGIFKKKYPGLSSRRGNPDTQFNKHVTQGQGTQQAMNRSYPSTWSCGKILLNSLKVSSLGLSG